MGYPPSSGERGIFSKPFEPGMLNVDCLDLLLLVEDARVDICDQWCRTNLLSLSTSGGNASRLAHKMQQKLSMIDQMTMSTLSHVVSNVPMNMTRYLSRIMLVTQALSRVSILATRPNDKLQKTYKEPREKMMASAIFFFLVNCSFNNSGMGSAMMTRSSMMLKAAPA